MIRKLLIESLVLALFLAACSDGGEPEATTANTSSTTTAASTTTSTTQVAACAPFHPIPEDSVVPGAVQFRDAGGAQDAGWTLVDTSPDPTIERPGLLNGSWVILDPGWLPCRDSDGYSYTKCVEIGPGSPFVLTEVVPSADPTEVLWTSTNGVNWTPEVIAAFEGKAVERGSTPHRVPVHGGLLWALVSPLGEAEDDEWWAANTEVWVTEDGTAWNQVQWLDSPRPNSRLTDVNFIDASRSGDAIFLTTHGMWLGPWASSDAGRTFAPVEPFMDESARVAAHWVSAGEFRAIVRTTGTESGLTLWRSADAITWNRMGTIEGLDAAAPWGTLKGSFSEEALVVLLCDRACVALVRSLDGGLTWQPLDGVSEFLSDRSSGPAYPVGVEVVDNEVCTHWSWAMDDWILVQTGNEVGVSRDGLDWYFIDGGNLSWSSGIYTDEGWAMPPPG